MICERPPILTIGQIYPYKPMVVLKTNKIDDNTKLEWEPFNNDNALLSDAISESKDFFKCEAYIHRAVEANTIAESWFSGLLQGLWHQMPCKLCDTVLFKKPVCRMEMGNVVGIALPVDKTTMVVESKLPYAFCRVLKRNKKPSIYEAFIRADFIGSIIK